MNNQTKMNYYLLRILITFILLSASQILEFIENKPTDHVAFELTKEKLEMSFVLNAIIENDSDTILRFKEPIKAQNIKMTFIWIKKKQKK